MRMKSCCKGTCFCVGEHFVSRDAGRVPGSITSNSDRSGHQGLGSDLGQTWQFHRWCRHQVSGFCVCVSVCMCECVCVCVCLPFKITASHFVVVRNGMPWSTKTGSQIGFGVPHRCAQPTLRQDHHGRGDHSNAR